MKHDTIKFIYFLFLSLFFGITGIFLSDKSLVFFTMAKENQISQPHNQISEACPVSVEKVYADEIPAYEACYYKIRIILSHPMVIYIKKAENKGKLIPKLLDHTGNPVHFSQTKKNRDIRLSLFPNQIKSADYIFLEIKNHAPENTEISLSCFPQKQVQETPTLEKTIKDTKQQQRKKKKPVKKSEKNEPKSRSSTDKKIMKNTLAASASPEPVHHKTVPKTLVFKQHFFQMRTKQKKKLSFSVKNRNSKETLSFNENDFIWLSTNEKTAKVKNGFLCAEKEGIAILYIKHPKVPSLKSSLLVRVYHQED